MSPATDGFSAMMSFLAMQRERPQMISANRKQVQPPLRQAVLESLLACARARCSVRQSRVRRGEQILCKERGLAVIEDCAHALGARLDGQPAGSFGYASFFSFEAAKPINTFPIWAMPE